MSERESKIERDSVKKAAKYGWKSYKFVSPAQSGVPDRLFIRKGVHVFIEFKKPGENPRPLQEAVAKEMRKYGANVFWADSVEGALDVLSRF